MTTSTELQVGDRVVRIDRSPLYDAVEGRVVSIVPLYAVVAWASGRTTRIALAAEGKRWRRVPRG